MPPGRGYRRRRYRRRRSYPSRKFKRFVKKSIIALATKYVDGSFSVASIHRDAGTNTSIAQVSFSDVLQGDSENNRDGNAIFMKSLICHWELDSGATDAQVVRIVIFKWQSGTIPEIKNVFDVVLANNNHLAQYRTKTEADFTNKYTILHDGKHNLGPGLTTRAYISFTLNLKGSKVSYNGALGNSFEGGQVYMCAFNDRLTASGNPVQIKGTYRLKYTDNL